MPCDLQQLSAALNVAASRATATVGDDCLRVVIPPLLAAASSAIQLAGPTGLELPITIVALAARNTYEIWLRIRYVIKSSEHCQRWRAENVRDQIQIYEAVLTLNAPGANKAVISAEIARLEALASAKGLPSVRSPLQARQLAIEVEAAEEHDAFYKLYSKLVHPSSWAVNSPSAVGTPMYRAALVANAELYGRRILECMEASFNIPVANCLAQATHDGMKHEFH